MPTSWSSQEGEAVMGTGRAGGRLLAVGIIAALGMSIALPAHAAEKSYSATEVARHATASSCWTIVGNGVYDITRFLSKHPGGRSAVAALCGKDGSAGFNGQHGGASTPRKVLASYRIGKLKRSTSGASATVTGTQGATITIEQIATHATAGDCWSMINGRAYNLTSFISKHPGGSARITSICGRDGSSAFAGQHAGSSSILRTLAVYEIGSSGTTQPPAGPTGANGTSTKGNGDDHRGQGEHDDDGTDDDEAGHDRGRDHDDD